MSEPEVKYMLVSYEASLADVEYEVILTQLERHSGDKHRVADILQISLKTLYNRLRELENHPIYKERVRNVTFFRHPRRKQS